MRNFLLGLAVGYLVGFSVSLGKVRRQRELLIKCSDYIDRALPQLENCRKLAEKEGSR